MCSSRVVVVNSSKSHLKNQIMETQAISESPLTQLRESVADGSSGQTPVEPEAKEQSGSVEKPSSLKERFISMPLWDFLIILVLFVAIGYVIGAAHQYAALT